MKNMKCYCYENGAVIEMSPKGKALCKTACFHNLFLFTHRFVASSTATASALDFDVGNSLQHVCSLQNFSATVRFNVISITNISPAVSQVI